MYAPGQASRFLGCPSLLGLVVLPTEVGDAACWWLTFEGVVATAVIVVMEPGWERGNALGS